MINTKPYWENRFSQDWDKNNGPSQTQFFCELATKLIPKWTKDSINSTDMSICDWGCAEGEGTEILSKFFNTAVTGVDFSETAIKKAKDRYPHLNFSSENFLSSKIDTSFNVIFSSNTLEHFDDPWKVFESLSERATDYIILLLPFKEINPIEEHFYSFDFNNIPTNLNGFRLCHSMASDTGSMVPTYWPGDQILLIFSNKQLYAKDSITLSKLNLESESTYSEKTHREKKLGDISERLTLSMQKTINLKEKFITKELELNRAKEGLKKELVIKESKIHEITEENSSLTDHSNILKLDLEDRVEVVTLLTDVNKQLNRELDQAVFQINKLKSSHSWRVTSPLRVLSSTVSTGFRFLRAKIPEYKFSDNDRKLSYITYRIKSGYLKHGAIKGSIKAIPTGVFIFQNKFRKLIAKNTYNKKLDLLDQLIQNNEYKFIDLFPTAMGWDTPLFQRFQHYSIQAAKLGGLAFYGGHPQVDNILAYNLVDNNLIVFDATDHVVKNRILKLISSVNKHKFVRIQSIDTATTLLEIENFLQGGYTVVYEYIDEISSEITGLIPEDIIDRHTAILNNENILVIATSDRLLGKVKKYRKTNYLLLTNGVDLDHWQKNTPPPAELTSILKTNKPVIGYHGALAKWIDYDILRLLTNTNGYEILLIGFEHDASFENSGLATHPNIHFLGSKSYFELSQYGNYYDIGIIPFKNYALTESVSPVKLFEYMALGIPIVTTDLPECRKYNSCLIASSAEDFIVKVREALSLRNDPVYKNLLLNEAIQNSWYSQAKLVYTPTRDQQ